MWYRFRAAHLGLIVLLMLSGNTTTAHASAAEKAPISPSKDWTSTLSDNWLNATLVVGAVLGVVLLSVIRRKREDNDIYSVIEEELEAAGLPTPSKEGTGDDGKAKVETVASSQRERLRDQTLEGLQKAAKAIFTERLIIVVLVLALVILTICALLTANPEWWNGTIKPSIAEYREKNPTGFWFVVWTLVVAVLLVVLVMIRKKPEGNKKFSPLKTLGDIAKILGGIVTTILICWAAVVIATIIFGSGPDHKSGATRARIGPSFDSPKSAVWGPAQVAPPQQVPPAVVAPEGVSPDQVPTVPDVSALPQVIHGVAESKGWSRPIVLGQDICASFGTDDGVSRMWVRVFDGVKYHEYPYDPQRPRKMPFGIKSIQFAISIGEAPVAYTVTVKRCP